MSMVQLLRSSDPSFFPSSFSLSNPMYFSFSFFLFYLPPIICLLYFHLFLYRWQNPHKAIKGSFSAFLFTPLQTTLSFYSINSSLWLSWSMVNGHIWFLPHIGPITLLGMGRGLFRIQAAITTLGLKLQLLAFGVWADTWSPKQPGVLILTWKTVWWQVRLAMS